ncbi:type II toxin-antitoxin system PemK/MazF family toxin [Anabaenopsis arnoldii]|nr:type II toxin-antitoxin system PemK/MazF family toxin [Anabaenopsis arnoldii]
MKRGEIYFANLSPTQGSDVDKRSLVLVVSNDINNNASTTVTILPIKSNTNRLHLFEVLLGQIDCGLSESFKVQVQQIRTISKQRISGDVVKCLDRESMDLVNDAMKLHLALE